MPSPEYPLSVLYFNPTRYCNLACAHCWISPPKASRKRLAEEDTIDLEQFIKIIADGKTIGLEGIKYTGGEPLLKKGIEEFLLHAQAEGLTQWFETNLTVISKDLIETLKKITPLLISFSIDHPEERQHDLIRGLSGAYKSTCANALRLSEACLPLQLVFTLSPANHSTIESMPELAKKLGAHCLKINILQPIGRAGKNSKNNSQLSIAAILETKRRLERQTDPGLEIIFDIPIVFRSSSELQQGRQPRCNILQTAGLLSDGSLSLCGIGSFDKRLAFANTREHSLVDIWRQHEGLLELRAKVPALLEGICARCFFKYNCLGACRAESFHRTSSFTSPFWFCELAEQEGLFPIERTFDDPFNC